MSITVFDLIKFRGNGQLKGRLKDALIKGYGNKLLHTEFEKTVELYRVARDMGLIEFCAKAGYKEMVEKSLQKVMLLVSKG